MKDFLRSPDKSLYNKLNERPEIKDYAPAIQQEYYSSPSCLAYLQELFHCAVDNHEGLRNEVHHSVLDRNIGSDNFHNFHSLTVLAVPDQGLRLDVGCNGSGTNQYQASINQSLGLTLRVLSLGLREERDLHFEIVLEGERFQGLVQRSGGREDDAVGNDMGVDDTRVKQVRPWRRDESLVDGDEVRVEAVGVEDLLLGRANHLLDELPDAVAPNVQVLPVRQQLEGSESVLVLHRGAGGLLQRLEHLVNHVQVLFLALLVLHHQVRVSTHDHRIVDVDGVVATLSFPGDVQRWIVVQIRGNHITQVLQRGGRSGWRWGREGKEGIVIL